MAKTTKAERQAFDAMGDAAGAAKIAKKVAKDLPGKQAKKLRAVASDAIDVADTSKKAVRKHPKRVRKDAEKATDAVLSATDKALRKVEVARTEAAEAKAAKKAKKAKKNLAPSGKKPGASAITVEELDEEELDRLFAGLELVEESELEALEDAIEEVLEEIADGSLEDDDEGSDDEDADAPELTTLTVVVLRERARDAGLAGYSRLTKAQLIELLS